MPPQGHNEVRSTMRASVVVMTFNRPASLRRCLESLETQSLDRCDFEIVVVDVSDHPVSDVLAVFTGRLEIVHLREPNLGVAANRNVGAKAARGATLAFLDDDCVATRDWLRALVEAVEGDSSTLAGGPVVHPSPTCAAAAAGQAITDAVDAFFNPPNEAARFLPGLNFALNHGRYWELGGCDASFGFLAAEDRDFIDRWLGSGCHLVLCPGAGVLHEHRSSFRSFIRQYFNYGRGAWRYHRLRRERRRGRMMEDARLHLGLPHYLRLSQQHLSRSLRAKVWAYLGLWQLANLAGFCFQGCWESLPQRKGGRHG